MDGLLRPNLVVSHLVVVKVGMMEVHSEDDISLEIEVVCIIGKKSSSSLWLEEHVEAPVDMVNILSFTGFYTRWVVQESSINSITTTISE